MVDSSILSGRPFGGCSILYRRHLSLSGTPIYSCSTHICDVKLTDSSGTSFSLICVYMPAESHSSSSGEYLNTLGEVEGFIDSLQCDNNIIVGDFNAHFDRGGIAADLLSDFVLDLNYLFVIYIIVNQFSLHMKGMMVLYVFGLTIFSVHRQSPSLILIFRYFSLVLTSLIICHCFSSFTLIILHSLPYLLLHRPNLFALIGLRLLHLILIIIIIKICFVTDYLTLLLSFCPAPFLIDLLMLVCWMITLNIIIMSTMLHCASYYFPCKKPSFKRVPRWKDSAGQLRRALIFWHRVWEDAGCPSSGVLSTIKRQAKKRYKFEVCRIKHRGQYLIRDRLAHSFTKRKKDSLFLDVKSINKSNAHHFSPVVDGVNGDTNIANAFASKFSAVLDKHSTSSSQTIPSANIQSSLTESHLSAITVSYDQITEAISLLKSRKSDAFGVTSEHLKYASPAIANVVSSFFTAILRHGYTTKF